MTKKMVFIAVLYFFSLPALSISAETKTGAKPRALRDSIGITASEILLGQSAALTGASRNLGIEFNRGAVAYFEKVNSSGGVNGRKIKLLSRDDGYDPERCLDNTLAFAKNEKVFALFGYVGTPTLVRALPAISKFFEDEKLFLFSNFTGAQAQRMKPYKQFVFNYRASYEQETKELVEKFYENGYRRFGLFIQNDAYGRSGADGVKLALEKKGLKIVSEVSYVRGVKFNESMQEQVKLLNKDSPDVIISIASYEAAAAFIRDFRQTSTKTPVANVSFVGPVAMLNILKTIPTKAGAGEITDNLVNSMVVPPFDSKADSLSEEFRLAVKTSAAKFAVPEDPTYIYKTADESYITYEGYLSAKLFVEILKTIPKDSLSRAEFIKSAENMKKTNLGLKSANFQFTTESHQASDSVYFLETVNNVWKELQNWSKFKK